MGAAARIQEYSAPVWRGNEPTYDSVVEALPEELKAVFTRKFHSAGRFRCGAVLDHWSKVAAAWDDPELMAAFDAASGEPEDAAAAWGGLL